jgi:2-keto-4-pentenoate hydratase/2-oxohepta-3-ene-1,7-dioic acid hydratase in catechol pathway
LRLATLRHRDDRRLALALVQDEDRFFPVTELCATLGCAVESAFACATDHAWLQPEGLAWLRQLDQRRTESGLPASHATEWRLAPPVPRPGKIVATGRNYMDHVREGQEIWAKRGKKVEIPEFPNAFAKFASSLTGPRDDIVIPPGLSDVDYEVELAVIIGRAALNVAEAEALGYVAGYAICNDLATRGIQRREMENQIGITLAKNFPGFAPMGPWLTTADAVPDPQKLRISLAVDDEVRQDASTADMMFPVAKLIAYWSQMGLEPGDIIITGTPSGVALARPEPERYFLRRGQLVTARIESLGELRNRVR